MELDDTWDPDPLPSCSSRNQSQPRFKKEKAHHSQEQPEPQPQYYQQSKTPNSQHRDDESSSDEHPVVLQQPQTNHKRVISPAQPAQDRRKRHQSEHPSRIERGRTTNVEEVVYDHISAISRSRNKSVARNDARYKVRTNHVFEGYQNVENSVAVSKQSTARSRSRARDLYEDQGYAIMENYNQQFDRQQGVFSPQNNAQTKRRMKEEPNLPGRGRKETSRVNKESVGTPKQRQRHGQSRAQSLAPRISNDNSDIQYLGTGNGTYSVRAQRQEKENQLRSPLWSSHDFAVPKPSSANRLQGRIDKPNSMKPPPHTPKNQSGRVRSVASDSIQKNSSQARTIDYGPIDDDDVYETPLENDLRRRSKSHSSVFRRKNLEVAEQVHQIPSSDSNRSNNSGVTIDLVTPESTLCARSSMPFIPQHWTPTRRGPIRVSAPVKLSDQDELGAQSEQQPGQNTHQHQAIESSPNKGEQPEENVRQQQAAKKIIRQELNANKKALQEELFEKLLAKLWKKRESMRKLNVWRLRDCEKRKRSKISLMPRGSERRMKQESRKRARGKRLSRPRRRKEEQQNADERRKAANKLLQEKREKDLAVAKAAEEKAQAAERKGKKMMLSLSKLKRQLEKLEAQVKAKSIADLSLREVYDFTPSTSMEVDNEGSLPTPQTQITPVDDASNTEKTSPPQATLPTNTEVEDEDSLFVSDNRKAVVETTPEQQISSGLQSTTGSFSSDSTIVQSLEHDRPPASMTEIFAKTILNPSGDKTLEDRDAEQQNESAAGKQKRAKSIPAEPNPETVAHKAATQATPKTRNAFDFASRARGNEANRQRVQAAAQARKENSNRARLEEKKAASAKKITVEYRKKKEKELIEEARKEGRIIGDSELEARLNKLMEKREREMQRKRNPSEELEPLFDSDESEESEEDPIDDETLEMIMQHNRKNNALAEATKAEIAFEKEMRDHLEKDPDVEEESQKQTATLNPDEHNAQIVPPMPNMTRYFEGQSAPRSSSGLETQSTLLSAPSQMARTLSAKSQEPTLVNEYRTKMFRQQEILEKWNSDRTYHGQVIHDEEKITKVFVTFKPMKTEDIDRYDPTLLRPMFANKYYTIRFEKVVEEIDPETQKVCMTYHTAGFADSSKLYTVLEMANHAAAEYLAKEVKPKEEEYHTMYMEELLPQLRTHRDSCNETGSVFYCSLEDDSAPWADFKSFEVNVELSSTEGPIN
ncbi:uncharacterized protein EAF02_003805 [Botrytis sinoallii]|uniref:uncharacterized protein n=1 Tax=Botrytis sinoallii TaxID=1463999 RepID=UPI0019002B79|nr:uncharacterized protein EAF02_003805 [Botrytis sinoallii]KAF7887158.1 hypothetical protein EAF02_003805 [Botrytis sinoallii]